MQNQVTLSLFMEPARILPENIQAFALPNLKLNLQIRTRKIWIPCWMTCVTIWTTLIPHLTSTILPPLQLLKLRFDILVLLVIFLCLLLDISNLFYHICLN